MKCVHIEHTQMRKHTPSPSDLWNVKKNKFCALCQNIKKEVDWKVTAQNKTNEIIKVKSGRDYDDEAKKETKTKSI